MGSKYVQARTSTAYRDAEVFLKQDRKVLFSGTPCQIAGLHHFLRKPYDNLLTVDIIKELVTILNIMRTKGVIIILINSCY